MEAGSKKSEMEILIMKAFDVSYWRQKISMFNQDYEINDDGVVRQVLHNNGINDYHTLGSLAMVTKVIIDIDSGERNFVISMITSDIEVVEHTFSSDIFNKYNATQLMKYGAIINISEIERVIALLQKSLMFAEVEKTTNHLGWYDLDGVDHPVYISDKAYLAPDNITISGSVDKYDLTPVGSIEEIKMLLGKVHDNVPLMTVLSTSISSLIFPLLIKEGLMSINGLMVSVQGASSTGKTTASAFAASLLGKVKGTEGSLRSSWNATTQAQVMKLANISGLALLYDELGTISSDNLGNFSFALSDGTERSRGQVDGKLRKRAQWDGMVILSTSESSIFPMLPSQDGTLVRVLELNGQMTRSSQEAEEIAKVINLNYGHAIPALMNIIEQKEFNNFNEILKKDFIDKKIDIAKKIGSSALGERISSNLAMIVISSKLLEAMFSIEVDTEAIEEYLIDQTKYQLIENSESSIAKHSIIQWILREHDRIGIIKRSYIPSHPIGYLMSDAPLDTLDTSFDVAILTDSFKSELTKIGIKNISTILNKFENEGFLIREEEDRRVTRRTIAGKRSKFYIIRLDRTDLKFMPSIANIIDLNIKSSTSKPATSTSRPAPSYAQNENKVLQMLKSMPKEELDFGFIKEGE